MKCLVILFAAFATVVVTTASENRIQVKTIFNEVTARYEGDDVELYCEYSIASGVDLPVTVTWKVGDGPRYASSIYECTGYTNSAKTCNTEQVFDPAYEGRIKFEQNYLTLSSVQGSDNRNYWCQVALEGSSQHSDEEFDMKSVVLVVPDSGTMPKFNTVIVQEDSVQQLGKEMLLTCECLQSSIYCEDIYWYKGPVDSENSNYDLIYSRVTQHYASSPGTYIQYQSYGDWEHRAVLSGDSLYVTMLKASDAGRYWCEGRTAAYKSIGEWGTDAHSTVVEIV
uniref:Ig-like domain-containing protein n=1 Tax=Ciona intestinalis TaxID=7719 RepID=H2XL41_CIOIN|nr:V region-containing chitin-binding protein D2-like precursor [Ciona intestinalis]|eukprot:NP_001239016.1 V region-containing chitin-binding protein D2-like precursor [Ciona intestinalis]